MSTIEQAGISNELLAALPADDFARLAPALERVDLTVQQTLFEAESEIDAAYFVEAGTISMLARLEDGGLVEVGMIGPEGMAGLPFVFGTNVTPVEAIAQVSGQSLRVAAPVFRRALGESPALMSLMLRYAQTFYAQVSLAAGCNATHNLVHRLARWLLMAHDRAKSDEFPLTHEIMAQMLAVHRPGVTIAAGTLQTAGFIRYGRGRLTILDRAGLEDASCECYRTIQRITRLLNDRSR
ncbi:Crp/Fnr family transcriptional regulator [Roseomonas populi]|uniref:Crp/Fnr family transcriptional regulator n=1 Tax=Roseomonas populi TaxID=3121582 RepID=A0ABT1X857_9PROT|nr:Crp/Fnr family transcriptional regulator [Roseomonas pecuniae]MCR0984290.1 Crp/Fnr family transcriptional regulator [Roseomonas pecuniae]